MAIEPGILGQDLHRHTLVSIFTGSLILRTVNLWLLADDPENFFTEDSTLYWPGASYAAVTNSERVPLYLLLLAGIRLIFGDAPLVAIFTQGLIDSGTCILIALFGSMIPPFCQPVRPMAAIYSSWIITELTAIKRSINPCPRCPRDR